MNVGTKLALGGVLAILPLSGGLMFAVTQVESLARQSALTAEREHRAAQLALQIMRGMELSSEYRRKLSVTGDAGYRDKLFTTEAQVGGWLKDLDESALTPSEREATRVLTAAWRRESAEVSPAETAGVRAHDAGNALLEATGVALEEHAAWAEERSRETTRLAVLVGIGAAALSAIIIWLLVRSIQQPLRQLIQGTRAVAGGDFEYRATPLAQDELGEVTEAFNHMVDSLGELDRLKAELVSRVSHELRTPLVAMIETNRVLLDEVPGPINERQRRMLELHGGAAARLTSMIQDLLDLSTLEASDAMEPKAVDLVALTREAVEQLAPLARERHLALDVGFGSEFAIARCDARRYQQVVSNLIDNAFKHSPAGGVVHVGLGICGGDALPEAVASEPNKSFAVLRVDDEGPGVEPSDRIRIFDKFVQSRRTHRGVGLGLAICKQIVTAHGGRVGVGDSALGGAAFFATFPVVREGA